MTTDIPGSISPRAAARRTSSAGPPPTPPSLDRAADRAAARLRALGDPEPDPFLERLERWWEDLVVGWTSVYGMGGPGGVALDRLVDVLVDRYHDRRSALRRLDDIRTVHPDWIQDPSMIGYVCYPASFGGTLAGVAEHLDYLEELRIRYVHLIPLLRSREGETDGGYAVVDYRAVDPALGTMDDLERLCDELRARGISLCLDLVLNHTAAEHAWARRAEAGDADAAAMYRIYPDRTMPDRFERTLPETFPALAPGNFTPLPDGRWVWTTFHRWQWDPRLVEPGRVRRDG